MTSTVDCRAKPARDEHDDTVIAPRAVAGASTAPAHPAGHAAEDQFAPPPPAQAIAPPKVPPEDHALLAPIAPIAPPGHGRPLVVAVPQCRSMAFYKANPFLRGFIRTRVIIFLSGNFPGQPCRIDAFNGNNTRCRFPHNRIHWISVEIPLVWI